MAIIWIFATFAGVVGIAWFTVMALLALVHLDKAPAIISGILALICLAFTIEAAGNVQTEYQKVMESIDHQN